MLKAYKAYVSVRPPAFQNLQRKVVDEVFSSITCQNFGKTAEIAPIFLILSTMSKLASEAVATLKVATLNVHGFCNEDGVLTVDLLRSFIKDSKADVIGLQEVNRGFGRARGGSIVEDVARGAGYEYFVEHIPTFLGNALYSKWPLEKVASDALNHKKDHSRSLITAVVKHPLGDFCIGVTHLNHQLEPTRLEQLESASKQLTARMEGPFVLVGDMNSLTRDDYTDKEWARVAEVRARGRWEAPKTEISEMFRYMGLIDMYSVSVEKARTAYGDKVEGFGALSTCRYDTRIDYVLTNAKFIDDWKPVAHRHIDTKLTDHSLVITEFTRRISSS